MGKQYFDAKTFNGELFTKYVDTLPKLTRNELLKSGAIYSDPNIGNVLSEQVGGNYITTPLFGIIGGAPLNYDGQTDITAEATGTASHSRVVVGRAKAWIEKDFGYDITGKTNFMDNVGKQVASYWEDIDQDVILSILEGIFKMTGTKNKEFVDKHTYDVTATPRPGFDATTLNNAAQQALGDNKNKLALIICHSAIATSLENLNLLEYIKYTDANGIQRDLGLATLNGKLVLIDDNMPITEDGHYTSYILGERAIEMTDVGVKVPYEMDRDPKVNGGQDTLYSRQRKIYAPYGISFTMKNMVTQSPTNLELANGTNWELAKGTGEKDIIDHKAIPIARIISTAATKEYGVQYVKVIADPADPADPAEPEV